MTYLTKWDPARPACLQMTLLYRNVKTPHDIDSTERPKCTQAWEKDWQTAFNPSKCQTIHFTRTRHPIMFYYTIHDHVLETDGSATYLDIKLHATASWAQLHSSSDVHSRKWTLWAAHGWCAWNSWIVNRQINASIIADSSHTYANNPWMSIDGN